MYDNETLSVAIYLANHFDEAESNQIFGEFLGYHIFNKWVSFGYDMMRFICGLDDECYKKLIDRACSIYNGRSLRNI